jgi:hypothetical protein
MSGMSPTPMPIVKIFEINIKNAAAAPTRNIFSDILAAPAPQHR